MKYIKEIKIVNKQRHTRQLSSGKKVPIRPHRQRYNTSKKENKRNSQLSERDMWKFLQTSDTLEKLDRKPTDWDNIDEIEEFEYREFLEQKTPYPDFGEKFLENIGINTYSIEDVWGSRDVEYSNMEFSPSFYAKLKTGKFGIREIVFLIKKDRKLYLVDTQGYNYPRYMSRFYED